MRRFRYLTLDLIGHAALVPLAIVVHVAGYFVPPWPFGCDPQIRIAWEPPIGIMPSVLWRSCDFWPNVLGWAGGPFATLLMTLAGVAIQKRLPRTGMILATTGLFLPGTLVCTIAFGGDPKGLAGYVLGRMLGITGWVPLLGLPAIGMGLFAWSLYRCEDRRRALLAMSLGGPLGLAAWMWAGSLL